MIDVSRDCVDVALSIDCDELLTSNMVKNWDEFLNIYNSQDLLLYWYNSVNNTLAQYRSDPSMYPIIEVLYYPLKHTANLKN